jgi:ribonuclease J
VVVHGGVNEIGGNKVHLRGEGGSLLLDFGTSFGSMAQFYSEFCQPRGHSFVGDQVALGLLPDVEGMYREDLLDRMGRGSREDRGVDALFLSHAHMDHMGMIPALRRDVPVHMSPASRAIMGTLDTVGQSFGMPDRFLEFTRKFQLVEAKRGGLRRGKGSEVREPRAVHDLKDRAELEVAPGLSVVPHPVDHSLPGAAGFIVHVDGTTWAYTGDLRFHGTHADLSRAFVDAAASEGVDVLLTEGTRVGEPPGRSEDEVRRDVGRIIEETDGLVLANYPPRDLDRIVSFYRAAREAGRELVVDLRQALLLDNLREATGGEVPRLGDGLRVFARRQRWGVVGDPAFPGDIQEQDYSVWERPYAFSPHAVMDHDIRQQQDRFVVYMDFFHLQAMIDLNPVPGSTFIRSVVEPFNEDMELDEVRVGHWMGRYGLEVHQCHASGHASGEDLARLVEAIAPRVVVPIHTERPDAFKGLHDDVRPPVLGASLEL